MGEEAFQANIEGHYYTKYITKARVGRRIGNVPHDENLPVFVAMDLGFNDAMAIWWYQKLGVEFTVLPRLSIQEGIDAVRNLLNRCWFDEVKCEKGIRALENYRKEWNDNLGTWRDHPRQTIFRMEPMPSATWQYLLKKLELKKMMQEIFKKQ